MPVTYRIDREHALIRTRCTGATTFAEVLHHFHELESVPSLPKPLDVLLDLTESRSIPESGQLRLVANEVGRLRAAVQWGSCAIVADTDVLFGMSRMFEVFVQAHFAHAAVFRQPDEAEHWLASHSVSPRRTARPSGAAGRDG